MVLAFIVIGVLFAAEIYIRTPAFATLLRLHIQPMLASTFRGDFTLGRVDTSVPGTLAVYDLRIGIAGGEIVRIPALRIKYSLIPLLWHQVRIKAILDRPQIDLRRDSNGEWNLARALAPKTAGSAGSAFAIHLARLDVRDGALALSPSPNDRRRYRLENVNIVSWLTIDPDGLEAAVSELDAKLRADAMPPAVIRGALSYRDTNRRALLEIGALSVEADNSQLTLRGVVNISPNLSIDSTVSIGRLAAADLEQIVHGYPLRKDIKGRATFNGPLDALRLRTELVAGHAQIDAEILGNLVRGMPTWNGHLSLSGLELSAVALPEKIAGTANATLDFKGEAAIDKIAASISLHAQDLQIDGVQAGNLVLTGHVQNGRAMFGGNLVLASGLADFKGEASLAEQGHYKLVVTSERLNLAQMSPSSPSTDLNARLAIAGTGRQLSRLNAALDFRMAHSTIAHLPLESSFRARISNRSIELLGATLASQGSVLHLKGELRLNRARELRLEYAGHLARLAPWLKLVGTDGDGRAGIAGDLTGPLREMGDMSLGGRGVLNVQSVRAYGLNLADARARYSFAGLRRRGWPSASVNAQFERLHSIAHRNIELSSIAARLAIVRGPLPRIRTEIDARDRHQHTNSVAAQIVIHPNRIAGTLDNAAVNLADGVWRLQHPASFVEGSGRISLQGLELANGERQLRLDALVERNGRQDVALHTRSFDLSLFEPLMPRNSRIGGKLTSDVTVNGTASSPLIRGSIEAYALRLNSQNAGSIDARFEYKEPSVSLGLVCHQDADHRLELNGDVPLTLSWVRGFTAIVGAHEHLKLQTAGIRLAPFAALAAGTLRNAQGMLRADLALAGSPFRPEMTGDVQVDGSGEMVRTGVTIRSFNMRLKAAPAKIEIVRLEAMAGQGSLQGSGIIELHNDYSPGAIDVRIQLQRWPAMATRQYNVNLDGDIQAAGTPLAPRIEGQIDVIDSTIYPDLAFLSGTSAPPPDTTIVVIEPGQRRRSLHSARSKEQAMEAQGFGLFKSLILQLRVDIHRNNWIRHENTQVELAGNLNVGKRLGGAVSIVGEIDTIRGWIVFMGKRFTLVNGQIVFTGGSQIDPTLHIDGQYLVSDYTIDVIIGGRASKPEIKLESQPQLAQGDILSLILFGTTSTGLGQGQTTTLRQRAQSIATGAVGQTLLQSLGLESMGVSVSGQSVGISHYVGPNTYVSVSPSLGANTSSTPSQVASIQYFLARWLSVTTATMSDGSRQIFVNLSKRY